MKTSKHQILDSDGTPFFWLADTAWNLWCRGLPGEWNKYIEKRKKQRFNVIQFVTGRWRGCHNPVHGRTYEVVNGRVCFNEAALEKLDLLIKKIHQAGMIAAPVMLWAYKQNDPGEFYDEKHCVRIGKTLLERYGTQDMVWLLGGDGHYNLAAEQGRWKRIGREVFSAAPKALATLHPCGLSWIGDAFSSENWYDIVGIQSGHGAGKKDVEFLVNGQYSVAWKDIHKPFINLEPNYEKHPVVSENDMQFDALHVRRAAYWSLTVAPPAGITYGTNSVWMWAKEKGEKAEGHGDFFSRGAWYEEMDTPGAVSMTQLRNFFEKLPWQRLIPAQSRLKKQPGYADIYKWQSLAATPEGDCLVAYAPDNDEIILDTRDLKRELNAYEVDPATGRWYEIAKSPDLSETAKFPFRKLKTRDRLFVLL